MTRYYWTTREMAILREFYPQGGINAVESQLDRTRSSIYQHARALGLSAQNQPVVRKHYAQDPEIDAELIALHSTAVMRGAVLAFAQRVGRPQWWVSKRARELGLKTPRFKNPPWSSSELEILYANAGLSARVIAKKLHAAGFHRTDTAVSVKLKRQSIDQRSERMCAGIYTGAELARMFGADGKAPLKWVRLYGLRATQNKDRGELRITEPDLRKWIIAHPERINLRRMPDAWQPWFIELLASRTNAMREAA